MEHLSLITQNSRGNEQKTKNNLGYVFVSFDNTKIYVDNYEGSGETYKQRETPEIFIESEGKTLFKGTIEELKEKLK